MNALSVGSIMFGNAAWIDYRARSIRRRFVPDGWQTDDWPRITEVAGWRIGGQQLDLLQ